MYVYINYLTSLLEITYILVWSLTKWSVHKSFHRVGIHTFIHIKGRISIESFHWWTFKKAGYPGCIKLSVSNEEFSEFELPQWDLFTQCLYFFHLCLKIVNIQQIVLLCNPQTTDILSFLIFKFSRLSNRSKSSTSICGIATIFFHSKKVNFLKSVLNITFLSQEDALYLQQEAAGENVLNWFNYYPHFCATWWKTNKFLPLATSLFSCIYTTKRNLLGKTSLLNT